MIVGIPREIHRHEHRVGLNPFAVSRLVRRGHTVVVESRAGDAARFVDRAYEDAGARIVYGADEIYGRADLICRVGALSVDELEPLRPGAIVCAFHHLAVASQDLVRRLMECQATLVGYELIRDRHGDRPVRVPFGEMAGQLAVHLAANLLQGEAGGRGVLLGTVPGVPPPTVLVLGAGTAGRSAAATALACGAHVIVLDDDVATLRELAQALGPGPVTVVASERNLDQYTSIADVVIGAVHIPGERAPFVVTESMVRQMKAGSVIIDLSIDQGGCVETSRPTQIDSPTYTVHDVVHHCVPNMTANIARTASRALVTAALPYVLRIADEGLEAVAASDDGLAEGVCLYRGRMADERIGRSLGLDATPLADLLREGSR